MYLRDYMYPDTYLVWKIHDGCIVESRHAPSLSQLITPASPGDDPPRIMEIYEVLRTLKYAGRDSNVRGIFADFSSLHVPTSVTPKRLGLAQIEELLSALQEFREAKREQFGEESVSTVAWSDTFSSQSQYLLASGFDRVYVQPSGQVPLVGLSSQMPFFKKLLNWVGVKVHAEAREKYKSMISPFTETDSLTADQLANQTELLADLNLKYAQMVGARRYPKLASELAAEHVSELAYHGPFSASEAQQAGLIDGTRFKRDVIQELVPAEEAEEDQQCKRWKTFPHYSLLSERILQKTLSDDQIVKVGVVYLLGSISQMSGPNSVSAALRGLKEAAEDPSIKAVVLRIDSGGGDVVASETLWDAVRRMQRDHKKPVIASFGNVAASGAYYIASAANAIFADESTVTGSIGVAALRPTITQTVLDRMQLHVQTIFTGSTAQSALQDLDEKQKQRMARHIDETYADFLDKVENGRGIPAAALKQIAGGRVWTGLAAWNECDGINAQVADQLKPFKKISSASTLVPWHIETEANSSGIEVVRILREPTIDAPDVDLNEAQKAALTDDLRPQYGRGLIDALGGLWDASMYAIVLTLQAEVDDLKATLGATEEAAMKVLRPKCARITQDEDTALLADMRLVRFPADKPFWQRLQQYDARMEPTSLSYITASLFQPLIAWWQGLVSTSSALEAMQNWEHHLRDASLSQSRLQAEYPFQANFL
ncbi:hypothetical protein MYAM1_000494 [Malassezia yamatoensis]|uniref:Peptidase S49 domain-containing protein n=1 Tax=Malassezia yamatoensis TaxID=253288 RepID=A0AAJ5YRA2_9BASI|nr:hypothetical protein MYAM1_000494 [Malassezia yamatoensis]